MSQTTKRALAQSLKHLMEQKPLEKITVVDISEDIGLAFEWRKLPERFSCC